MTNQKELSPRQLFILTFSLTVGTSILVTPAGLAQAAREDAWLGSLVSLVINILMAAIYLLMIRLYPGKTLFEIHEAVLGKIAGKVLNLLYLFYFLILTGTLLGNLGFFISSEIMPETPIEAVQGLFLLSAVICARLGVIILARVGELMFPFILILFLILVLALSPQIEWSYILPVMEEGLIPILKAGFHASMFQELVVMVVFFSLVKGQDKGKKALINGSIAGGAILTIIVVLSILILGIEQTENSTFPAFALAKTINVGNFFQRVEGILITMWIMTFFVKISLLFLAMLQGLQTVFGLQLQTPFIYPLAVLFIIVSWNTYINTVYVADIIQNSWVGYAMLHLLAIPLLIVCIGYFKMKWLSTKASAS